jgi:hypothetical protein
MVNTSSAMQKQQQDIHATQQGQIQKPLRELQSPMPQHTCRLLLSAGLGRRGFRQGCCTRLAVSISISISCIASSVDCMSNIQGQLSIIKVTCVTMRDQG